MSPQAVVGLDEQSVKPYLNLRDFDCFLDRALYLAALHVDVIVVRPRSKEAIQKGWPQAATQNLDTVRQWAKQFPNHNTGAVANPDTLWLLDGDDPTIPERYERDTGETFPTTFAVASRPGHCHYYFRPTDASRGLGNQSQDKVVSKAFSVRAKNEYVVGPGSIHPVTGKPYLIVCDDNLVPVPDSLIAWIKTQIEQPKQRPPATPVPASTQKIPEGGRNSHLTSVAGRLHRAGLSAEGLLDELLRRNKSDCDPPLPDHEVQSIAKSIGRYEQPDLGTEEQEDDVEIAEEPLPEFPVVPGSVGELSEALCADLPMSFKVMAAITRVGLLLSGKTCLASDAYLQPRFYTCLVGPPWCGKSAALNDVERFLKADFTTVTSIDSGPALVETFHDLGEGVYGEVPRRLLLNPDELRDVFEKAKATSNSRNSLLKEYITLYQENETESRTVGRGVQECRNAYLAMIGGAQPEVYEEMWTATGSGASGLQSRFVLAAANKRVPATQGQWDAREAAQIAKHIYAQVEAAPTEIRTSPDAAVLFDNWWTAMPRDRSSEARIPDMVKRFLIVLAVTNSVDLIDPWLMQVGIAFGDHQIALRERFNPSDSYTWVQDAENKILKAYEQHGWMTPNHLRRLLTPHKRMKGGYETFNRALRNLIAAGALADVGKSQRAVKLGIPSKLGRRMAKTG